MSLLLSSLVAAEILTQKPVIPEQNQKKPELSSLASYQPESLLKQINNPTVEGEWNTLFFPQDAFRLVKGIKDPDAYHKQLLKWFATDVKKEHERLKAKGPWTVESFKLGGCKWKEKGVEANALPYWSCYKSKLRIANEKGEKELIEIRTLINWGPDWFITHLGPIPKS